MNDKELDRVPSASRSHTRIKVVHFETKRIGLFGRVVVSILGVLALGGAFLFSLVVFSVVIVIAILGLLQALWVSRSARTRQDPVIEGNRVVGEKVLDIDHEDVSHRR